MTNAARQSSLIERAAEVYDFGKHLRGTTDSGYAANPPLQGEGDHAQHGGGVSPDRKSDTPSSGADTPATSPSRGGFGIDDPAMPEWFAAPVGVAAIDRAMLAQKGMLVPGAPIGALAEEFRLVKRQLLLTAKTVASGPLGDRARTILVGSGKPGDGKTFCAINLALSLAAERDTNVLLVDGDFAKPDVMKTLGQDDSTGFLDALGDDGLDPESCVVATDVPHLSLMPSGKRTNHDTELLASARTGAVIDRLLAADPRRIIIFDTPPALAASPASVMALQVGQVMLVVRADRTTEGDVAKAVGLLDRCEHISLVLNAVSYAPGDGRFGSYYGQER
ncbi:Exopolysaccharide/PEP-CTERM locus tyrosine autokinase [Sphingomonas sp. EC-HK361]|uniref:AAA family ATPase n=1 Tax=Sphingomonas sp. EC-HK361 TaxID=2038397 RepID=UPI00125BD5AB|nr:AAA family ATPase [Sphingomonas sp. EC-HK361]VVT03825.1 Exopolysaccharide/PEP-CTERM locus tyrosine autokinase [Sphingomonas sp. EC-HK361]